jgi:type IV pilus assembly protein PilB
MVKASAKIRRLLTDAGLVSAEQWDAAAKGSDPVLEVLFRNGQIDEKKLFHTLGKAAGVMPIDLARVKLDPSAVETLQRQMCVDHCVLPIARTGEILTIAVSDPFDVLVLDDLNILTGCRVRPVLSHPVAIKAALSAHFDKDKKEVEAMMDQVANGGDIEVQDQQEDADLEATVAGSGEDAPAVKLVNVILLKALKEKASDIHIEPMDGNIRVRFRIDGRLVEQMRPPRALLPALTSRLKILASLDIAERQGPQDGKFQVRHEGRAIDFRLSTLPVVGGEKAVMRILDQKGTAQSLVALGYEPKALADISQAITSAYGMMLVTGPTGSGKSTTLYACVKEVAVPEINCVTVEDPVEYRMDGINQVPVNPKRGLTFAGALRSILRQDPDVVLVGEIRDKETAEIAVKAALTGHLVLSTLHTNDAPSTITRLVDMGIDPFMVSSSLICIAAQRLVRKLCEHCREPVELPAAELRSMGFLEEEIEQGGIHGPHKGGCTRCKNGYRGRFALLETLLLENKIKRMVVEGRSALEIKAEGINQGMLTLRRVGILNVLRAKTSLEEVMRVTVADR